MLAAAVVSSIFQLAGVFGLSAVDLVLSKVTVLFSVAHPGHPDTPWAIFLAHAALELILCVWSVHEAQPELAM